MELVPKVQLDTGCKDKIVRLNVGSDAGVTFSISRSAIDDHPDGMLSTMFSQSECQPSHQDEHGAYVIRQSSQSAIMFNYIARYLHQEQLDLDDLSVSGLNKLASECDFYQLHDLQHIVKGE
eukprot:gene2422-3203_t